jgi:sec-independent protein translocase protein TatB
MFNVGGGEFLVILLIALIVLGPQKLPEAARQVGNVARELKRMSASFQSELRQAMDEPVEEASRERGRKVVSSEEAAAPDSAAGADDDETSDGDDAAAGDPGTVDVEEAPEPEPPAPVSTAEAAGMYDIVPDDVPGRDLSGEGSR